VQNDMVCNNKQAKNCNIHTKCENAQTKSDATKASELKGERARISSMAKKRKRVGSPDEDEGSELCQSSQLPGHHVLPATLRVCVLNFNLLFNWRGK